MADYEFRPGGSLKLKGGIADGGIKKKKKSKSKPKDGNEKERARVKELLFKEDDDALSPPGSSRGSPALAGSSDRKTDAERRFEEVQRRRLETRVAKLANKSHKERVNEFNAKLESLSEHHDIPKVGPG